jgi:chaperone modulatory protein CbpM
MIGIDVVITEIAGLHREDLERWIDNDWVRPGGRAGAYVFFDIDVERVRLIQDLRHDMQIDEEALPVVLMLLDQVYDLRRRMRELGEAIELITTGETRLALVRHLTSASHADPRGGESRTG